MPTFSTLIPIRILIFSVNGFPTTFRTHHLAVHDSLEHGVSCEKYRPGFTGDAMSDAEIHNYPPSALGTLKQVSISQIILAVGNRYTRLLLPVSDNFSRLKRAGDTYRPIVRHQPSTFRSFGLYVLDQVVQVAFDFFIEL